MADIVKAIEKEKEYLSYRKKGEEPFHLIDAVRECGFDSLDAYYNSKADYEFSQLSFELIVTTTDRAIADVMTVLHDKRTAVLFADTENTIIWNGVNSRFNESYCEECGIPVYPLQTNGGTIVSTKGDLNIGICVPETVTMNPLYILDGLANILRKHTNKTVIIDGNDILVDGYKVMGSSHYKLNQMFMFITPVSLTEKSELISIICEKHSNKEPMHIDFLNKETLKQEVLTWLKTVSI